MNRALKHTLARGERGSALLAAMCFAAVFAVSLASYLALCYQTLKTSDRGVQSTRSLSLAESGIEDALWTMNQTTVDWSGWTLNSGIATKTISGFSFENGATGNVAVTVNSYDGSAGTKTVTAVGTINLANGTTLSRTVKIGSATKSIAKAPVFTNAISALTHYNTSNGTLTGGTVNLTSGGLTVDSYDSSVGLYNSSTNSGYAAVVAAGATSGTAVTIANGARVKGYVATPPNASGSVSLTYGSTAYLTGPSTPGTTKIDTSRQTTSPYQTSFDVPTITGGTTISEPSWAGYTFPASGTYRATVTSGWFYVRDGPLVVDGAAVTLVVPGSLYIQSSGQIIVKNGGSLQLVVAGSAYLYYNGIDNQTKLAKNVAIIGNHTSTGYGIYVWSPTKFYGTIYAPKAEITIWGYSSASEVFGAIVGNNVTVYPYSSTALPIHYDKALRNSDVSFSAINAPYAVPEGSWSEISP